MNKSLEIASEINKLILDTSQYKEYIRLKSLIDNDPYLQKEKKLIVRAKSEGREEDWKLLIDKFNLSPLVVNYSVAKQELIELLTNIKEIIN